MYIYTKQEIYRSAFNLLDKFDMHEVPVDPFELITKLNICTVKFKDADQKELECLLRAEKHNDAFSFFDTFKNEQVYYIYYDETLDQKDLRMALAREIGRYIFRDIEDEDYEDMALDFASMLLVPMVCLFFVDADSPDQIMSIFNVNREVADCIYTIFKRRLTKYGSRLFKFEADSFMQYD